MGNTKAFYEERNAAIRERYAAGATTDDLEVEFGVKHQRLCQILCIPYNRHAPKEPAPPKPKRETKPVGPYWVTCRDEHRSFLEWFWPESCYRCRGRNIERERVSWA